MIEKLLSIKEIREENAAQEVIKCRNALDLAKKAVIKKQKALEDYIQWRIKEEQQLYQAVLNLIIEQRQLELLKFKVNAMREHDSVLAQEVEEAIAKRNQAEETLKNAKTAHFEAIQAVNKFKEFLKALKEEEIKELQRLEDLEMEEFMGKVNK